MNKNLLIKGKKIMISNDLFRNKLGLKYFEILWSLIWIVVAPFVFAKICTSPERYIAFFDIQKEQWKHAFIAFLLVFWTIIFIVSALNCFQIYRLF